MIIMIVYNRSSGNILEMYTSEYDYDRFGITNSMRLKYNTIHLAVLYKTSGYGVDVWWQLV